jgi:hypothetical protein
MPRRRRHGRRRRRRYVRHGLYVKRTPDAAVDGANGTAAAANGATADVPVEQRGPSATALARDQLIADLGGVDAISEAQRMLIDAAVFEWWKYQQVSAHLAALPRGGLVNKTKHRVHTVVRDHSKLAARLQSMLVAIGLQRQPKPIEDFHEYIRRRGGERDGDDDADATP